MTIHPRPGISQDIGLLVVIRNVSGSPCTLDGIPAATTARLSSGAMVAVPSGSPGPGAVPRPIDLAPETMAYVSLFVPSECLSGQLAGKANTGPPYYTSLSLAIAGATHSFGGLSLPATCRTILVSAYYS